MASVSVRNVDKRFGDVVVMQRIDLDIADGEFVVLVGASGCGKSTLLRMIAGLESITAGDILIGGRRVNDLEPRERDIAMVFQSYALYPHLDVRDNMSVSMKLRRRTPADEESQILSFADVRIDPDRFEAWRGGRPLHLTRTEFSLLQVLVRNATRVLTRDALFEAIWGFDMSATANNLQVYVSYLRRKMEAEGEPRLIYTLRGLGYTLRDTPP